MSSFTYEKFLRELALALLRNGHSVTLVTGSAPIRLIQESYYSKFLHVSLPIFRTAQFGPLIFGLFVTWRFFLRNRFDLINVHTPLASYIARLALIFNYRPSLTYTVHGYYFHEGQPLLPNLLHKLIEFCLSFVTSTYVFVSREDYEFTRNIFIKHRSKDCHLVRNTIERNRFLFDQTVRHATRHEIGFSSEAIVVGMVCRFTREKGLLEFLTACSILCAKNADMRVLIVGGESSGDGDSKFRQEFDVASRNLGDKLVITGLVDNVHKYLCAMDVFCLPSYREGYPYSLIEALSNGCICVASRIRGCREISELALDQLLLVPPREWVTLSNMLASLTNAYRFNPKLRIHDSSVMSEIFSKPNSVSMQYSIITGEDLVAS